MAHAAPTPSARGGAPRPVPAPRRLPPGGGGPSHGGGPTRVRRPGTAAWSLPLLLGVLYGFWAAQIDRNAGGNPRYSGPITAANVAFGVVSGLVVAALCFLLHRLSPHLPREVRALAWGAFAGAAFGYLYGLTGASVFRTVAIGLLTAAGIAAMTFYRYVTSR